jgi:DNA-binding CsgD family transcriptional regulator
MVLLAVRTVEIALAEANLARRMCPKYKIVAVLEDIPRDCFWKLASSELDGCVPLHVSQDFFVRTLDLVMSDGARIIALADDHRPSDFPNGPENVKPGTERGVLRCERTLLDGTSTRVEKPPIAPDWKDSEAISDAKSPSKACSRTILATLKPEGGSRFNGYLAGSNRQMSESNSPLDGAQKDKHRDQPARIVEAFDAAVPALSERQRQIIDGLVKGQANKTIARACGITEATVKVHMKAILRKVPCSNRTQVAIWAIKHASFLPGPRSPAGRRTPKRGAPDDAGLGGSLSTEAAPAAPQTSTTPAPRTTRRTQSNGPAPKGEPQLEGCG